MVTYHQHASDVDKCKIHIKIGFSCNPIMFFEKYALRTEFRCNGSRFNDELYKFKC